MTTIEKTLNKDKVSQISQIKKEPTWMKNFRLKSFKKFEELEQPNFGPFLNVPFDTITYYKKISDGIKNDWEQVDKKIKNTFDKIGLIESEKKYLDGVGAQFESEVVYHHMIEELEEKNVIFCDTDT